MIWWLLGAALLGGFGYGAFRAAQSPVFYAAVISLLWEKIKPAIFEAIAKDFSPEWREKVQDAARRGEDIPPRVGHREH